MQNKLQDLSNCHYKTIEIYDSQFDAKFDRLSVATTTERMGLRDFGVQCEIDRGHEHHSIVEITQQYRDCDSNVSRKETHGSRWTE